MNDPFDPHPRLRRVLSACYLTFRNAVLAGAAFWVGGVPPTPLSAALAVWVGAVGTAVYPGELEEDT